MGIEHADITDNHGAPLGVEYGFAASVSRAPDVRPLPLIRFAHAESSGWVRARIDRCRTERANIGFSRSIRTR
jgi:hypothetical protein